MLRACSNKSVGREYARVRRLHKDTSGCCVRSRRFWGGCTCGPVHVIFMFLCSESFFGSDSATSSLPTVYYSCLWPRSGCFLGSCQATTQPLERLYLLVAAQKRPMKGHPTALKVTPQLMGTTRYGVQHIATMCRFSPSGGVLLRERKKKGCDAFCHWQKQPRL